MKSNIVILVGALIVGVCILASGGIYEGVPGGSGLVFRLNKFTGEVVPCPHDASCISLKDDKR